MIYQVKAKFNYDVAEEFYHKLMDGTISKQKPDGSEIVRAMNSAIIDQNGYINWTEKCFCPIPLMHERKTVYDFYFTTLKTKVISKHKILEGVNFVDKLSSLVNN